MLRAFAERLTRSLSFRRTLSDEFGGGRIYVSGSAGLRYILRPMHAVDPSLCALVREFVRAGWVIWDVGANVGLFTFAAAHLAGPGGRVVSMEPDASLVRLLRRSSRLQPVSSAPVEVLPIAIAKSCDLRTFNIAMRSRSTNFLAGYGSTQTGGIAEQQTVLTASLDWLAERLPMPDLIKIDVEGAELEVVAGALRLLKDKRPLILCEVSSEQSIAVGQLLRDSRYSIYDGDSQPHERKPLKAAPWSTVAVPMG